MHRTDGDGHSSNLFTDGTPGVVTATQVEEDWLNAVQEELCNAIEDLGGTLVKGTNDQLYTRLIAIFGRLANANTWSAVQLFNGSAGDTNAALQTLTGPTNRKLLWQIVASSGAPTVYVRLYATVDKAFEVTSNAGWDGSLWVPDTTSLASTKLRIEPTQLFYCSAAAGPADFTDVALGAAAVSLVPANFTKGNILGVSTTGGLGMVGPAAGVYAHETIALASLSSGAINLGGGNRKVSYFKDAFGVVHIEGICDGNGVASSGDTLFTLPANYRPAGPAYFLISNCGVSFVPMLAEIQTDGDVVVTQSGGGLLPSSIGFDGISFHPAVTTAA